MAKSIASIRMPNKIFNDPELQAYFKNITDVIRDLENKPNFLQGDGSPESAVTAKIQTYYFNLTGSSGSFAYIKTTDGGNTGWIAYA